MAKYFSNFPQIYYSSPNSVNYDVVTNIVTRFAIEKDLRENSVVYYNYTIIDGETPEIIAAKLYDNPERHWIVLLVNEIIDPQFEWPLQQNTFLNFINEKYSAAEYANTVNTAVLGINWAKTNTHSYYKKEIITSTSGVKEQIIEVSEDSYNNSNVVVIGTVSYNLEDGNSITIETQKFEKTYFEYENEINENRRNIKILKKEFVYPLEEELEKIVNE